MQASMLTWPITTSASRSTGVRSPSPTYVPTKNMVADAMTKSLPKDQSTRLMGQVMGFPSD